MFIAVGTLSVLAVTAAAAWGNNPPGTNGTVKVGGVLDDTQGQDSHVDCGVQIEFAGYDEGLLNGTASLELVPPSERAVLDEDSTFIGEDPAGGANDLDATLAVDLTEPLVAAGVAPHNQQGFHVTLTVHADGSIGADTKHKTFWVSDCGDEEGGEGGEE